MSDSSLPKQTSNEEVDLFQLFDFFENKAKSFFRLIFKGLMSVFNVLMSFLQILQQNFVKIAIVIIIAFGVGYTYDLYKPKVYASKMIVKPFFESKYQLVTNIKYYNELVGNEDFDKLSSIFGLTREEANSLLGFSINAGPENEKIKTKLFNSFMKSLDTTAAATVDYDKFVENITIYDASLYEIEVKSNTNNVFGKLSNGFKRTFKSEGYSLENKRKKEILFKLKKASIIKSLGDIDTLKKVYIDELSKDKSQKLEVFGSTALKIGEERLKTKEFEILQLQLKQQNKLTILEEESIEENQLFEVISDFQLIGSVNGGVLNKMKLMFPLATLLLAIFGILGMRFNKFVTTYNIKN